MTTEKTTTIRVPVGTRERLNALAADRGTTAGELVSTLVATADEEAWLERIEARFASLASDPAALASYRAESSEIEAGFDAPTPAW